MPQNFMWEKLKKMWYIFNQYTQTEEDILPHMNQVQAFYRKSHSIR